MGFSVRALVPSLVLLATSLVADDPTGTTDLHRAAYEDSLEEVVSLLESGTEVDKKNRYGVTALSLACRNGNARMAKALLEAGADPNLALPGGETPLMTAARVGRIAPVRTLLDAGAEVDAEERRKQTALMWAAAEGHADVVEILIEAGADPSRELASGFSPMMFAARNGCIDVVRVLLENGIDPNLAFDAEGGGRKPSRGTSALRMAVENGHFELAVVLLESGADPDDQRSGFAPLHILTWVRKPNRGDGYDGMPPPEGSGEMSSLEFARKLVRDFGADVNLKLKRGESGGARFGRKGATAFLMAARRADLVYLKTLLGLGANPLEPNADGTTPLLAVAGVGSRAPEEEAGVESEALETIAWLHELGGKVNTVNKQGETAMHGAAYRNWPEMVNWLTKHGAEIELWNRKNRRGWTPLLIAQGFRPGNFKPSAVTVDAIKRTMRDAGVEIPPDPPLPTTDKPKKYEP
jgi:ankyrin repeat protein